MCYLCVCAMDVLWISSLIAGEKFERVQAVELAEECNHVQWNGEIYWGTGSQTYGRLWNVVVCGGNACCDFCDKLLQVAHCSQQKVLTATDAISASFGNVVWTMQEQKKACGNKERKEAMEFLKVLARVDRIRGWSEERCNLFGLDARL